MGNSFKKICGDSTSLWKKHLLYQIKMKYKNPELAFQLLQKIRAIEDKNLEQRQSFLIKIIRQQRKTKQKYLVRASDGQKKKFWFKFSTQQIQNEMQSDNHPLHKLIRIFGNYFQNKFSSIANPSNSTQSKLIQDFQQFSVYLGDSIILYYNLDDLQAQLQDSQIFNTKNITNFAVKLLFKDYHIEATIFNIQCLIDTTRNNQLNFNTEKYSQITLGQLGVSEWFTLNDRTLRIVQKKLEQKKAVEPNYQVVVTKIPKYCKYQPYKECIIFFKQMIYLRNPQIKLNKFQQFVSLYNQTLLIQSSIKKFYNQNNIPIQIIPSIDADNLISVIMYIVIKSKLPNLLTHLKIVELFSQKQLLNSPGGYTMVSILACLDYIRSGIIKGKQKLKLDNDDYKIFSTLQNYLSKNAMQKH